MNNIYKGIPAVNLNSDGTIDVGYEIYARRMKEAYNEHVIDNMNIYDHNYHQYYKHHEKPGVTSSPGAIPTTRSSTEVDGD